MTEEHIKEKISLAYIRAVSAAAGFTCEIKQEDYGIDGSINYIRYFPERNSCRDCGIAIDFQAKSTVNAFFKNDELFYDLKIKNYLDLIDTNVGRQRILILYLLPPDSEEWINITPEMTILKKCAYWCSLRGQSQRNNEATVRIKIPTSQILTKDSLIQMMDVVKAGGWL